MAKKRIMSARNKKKITANSSTSRTNSRTGYRKSGGNHNTNTKRDVWEVGGLPEDLEFDDFYNMYRRCGLAKAGVLRPVERCWQTMPTITDGVIDNKNKEKSKDKPKTKFEKEVDVLINDYNLFQRLIGLDYRQRVGRYAGIVIIAKQQDKTATASDPLVGFGLKSLVKLMPVFESQIDVSNYIEDISSVDFGNPESYNFKSDALGSRSQVSKGMVIDPSRVFAFGEGADDGSIFGVPALEGGFNALSNWEKIGVASAEGHFKNAKQRIVVNVSDTETASAMNTSEEDKEAFSENVEDFGAGWDSSMLMVGADAKTLQSSVQDPTGPANISLQDFVASINIPKTELIGFETGERSSSENGKSYNTNMMSRRINVDTPMIIGLLKHLIDIKILTPPQSGKIGIEWDDLLATGDAEKFANSSLLADVNQKSFQSGVGSVFTPQEIRKVAGFEENNEDLEDDIMGDDDEQEKV